MATIIGFGGHRPNRRSAPADPGRDKRQKRRLGEVLSLSMIPQFLLAYARAAAPEPAVVEPDDAEHLAPIAVHESAHVLLERVEAIMQRGMTAEEVFVDLLAPAARWMGQEWEEDRLDFVEVSMGLWRLQEVLREIAAGVTRGDDGGRRRTALFAPMPGDQHSFGASMVQECFTIAGWDADLMLEPTVPQLIERAAAQTLDLLGLSLSCDCAPERLASLVRGVRSVSANPNIRILIGGRVPREQPNLVVLSGADGAADSAPAAVKLAERMVNTLRMAATA